MAEKKSLTERFTDVIMDKVAGPIATLSNYKIMLVIREGLIAVMPVILIGSSFLLLYVIASPSIGTSGKPLVGFLEPYGGQFIIAFQLTMGLTALYASLAFSYIFGKVYKLNQLSLAVLGLSSFILLTTNSTANGAISIANFGGGGLFVALIASLVSSYIFKFCIDKHLIIKMPAGVPQGIGDAFSALIPFLFSFLLLWGVRTIANIDVSTFIGNLIAPLFSAADNIFVYTIRVFISLTFWSIGIHGDSILMPVLTPAYLIWLTGNATAATAGTALNKLPYIWTQSFERTTVYTASMWGLMFWQLISRRRNHRVLALASLPSAACCIIEPIVFGTPVVMNGLLMIPWILSGTISSFLGYFFMTLGLTNRFFIDLPWATPSPILAVVSSGGDWRNLALIAIAFITGILVYMPFFKALEKQEEANVVKE